MAIFTLLPSDNSSCSGLMRLLIFSRKSGSFYELVTSTSARKYFAVIDSLKSATMLDKV